jgi:ornithine carbamoyltransferase
MKNFLNISDLSSGELRAILDEAKSRKSNRQSLNKSASDHDKPFEGKSMVMILKNRLLELEYLLILLSNNLAALQFF